MRESCSDVSFGSVVRFMQRCSQVPNRVKEKEFKYFLQCCVPRPSPDIFQIFRLLLPAVSA